MLHINKFQYLHLIACFFQQICTDRIGQKRRHPFPDQSILQNRLQQIILNLFIHFVLTARHRQNHFCAPFYGFFQRIISRCITGVQGYDHIYMIHTLILCNITRQEGQFFISVFLCQILTMRDNICFQIQSDDPYIIVFQLMQIIIHGKRQIRLATTEIYDNRFSVFWKLRNDIFNKF